MNHPNSISTADHSGWRAELNIAIEHIRCETRLGHLSHSGPLRVQKPFLQPDGSTHIYILHPPGGLVGGDRLKIDISAAADTMSLFTSPSAGKFYRCLPSVDQQRMSVRLRVGDGAHLEWLPQETIFFDGARASLDNQLWLAETASYIGWEILCLGRRASGEDYSRGQLSQETRVHRVAHMIHRERLVFSNEMAAGAWGLAGRSVVGTLVAIPSESDPGQLDRAVMGLRELVDARFLGVTRRDRTIMVRYLGDSAEYCRVAFENVRQQLRQASLFNAGPAGETPRIWNT